MRELLAPLHGERFKIFLPVHFSATHTPSPIGVQLVRRARSSPGYGGQGAAPYPSPIRVISVIRGEKASPSSLCSRCLCGERSSRSGSLSP
ncbi:hypothetical protein SBV1_950019 [Verrucomicrobia bacterium]|nr:hypothetical protein SBV1_950019 [Verrucomicrobiota bacterium]